MHNRKKVLFCRPIFSIRSESIISARNQKEAIVHESYFHENFAKKILYYKINELIAIISKFFNPIEMFET